MSTEHQPGAEQAPGPAEGEEELRAAETAEAAPPAPEDGVHEADEQPDGGAAPEEEVEGDLDELRALAAKRDEYLALAQRTQADFENYRKRMAREVGVAERRGTARLAKELLPALDSLGRALEHAGEDKHLAEGLTLVQRELLAALGRAGIESYSPEGEPFDPNAHEAMAQQPVEGAETGTIIAVYQSGFRHGDHVLRPARVVVAA
jgi:molecular chaperone GrpE